jgi:asparagine synthase (glutamine-hydrolysing)
LYDNVEHLVLRSDGGSPLDRIRSDATIYQQPIAQPCNYTWLAALNEAASISGAKVLLTGSTGNLTLSAGGPSVLADFVRSGRWGRWWEEAQASTGKNGWRLRGVLASSFAPWVPASIWEGLNRVNGTVPGDLTSSLLNPQYRGEVEAALSASDAQKEQGSRRNRWRMLQRIDSGNYKKVALARWGIDERDPTADRGLIEFCLSLPPEQLLSNGVNRRLARAALSDRLPPQVLNAPRGYQFADWYETLDRGSLEQLMEDCEATNGGASVLDFNELRRLTQSWPEAGWASFPVIGTYRILMLRALAAAAFESELRQ